MTKRETAKWLSDLFHKRVAQFARTHGGISIESLTVRCPIRGEVATFYAEADDDEQG